MSDLDRSEGVTRREGRVGVVDDVDDHCGDVVATAFGHRGSEEFLAGFGGIGEPSQN